MLTFYVQRHHVYLCAYILLHIHFNKCILCCALSFLVSLGYLFHVWNYASEDIQQFNFHSNPCMWAQKDMSLWEYLCINLKIQKIML